MVGVATFGAAFFSLAFIGAISPVMALDKASGTYFVFVNDLPLVIGGGAQSQHIAVGGSVIVGGTLFGAPSTPRCVWVVTTSWRMVGFFGRVGIECEDIRRVRFATGNVAVLFVPSRGASLGFWHGALFGMGNLLRLGRLRRTWGRRRRRCCWRRHRRSV